MATKAARLKRVTLKIRWTDLLGAKPEVMPHEERRARWERWKALAGNDVKDWWTDVEETCSGCIHLDGDWCKNSELPAKVNPILTFSSGVPGMACMGLGYENPNDTVTGITEGDNTEDSTNDGDIPF